MVPSLPRKEEHVCCCSYCSSAWSCLRQVTCSCGEIILYLRMVRSEKRPGKIPGLTISKRTSLLDGLAGLPSLCTPPIAVSLPGATRAGENTKALRARRGRDLSSLTAYEPRHDRLSGPRPPIKSWRASPDFVSELLTQDTSVQRARAPAPDPGGSHRCPAVAGQCRPTVFPRCDRARDLREAPAHGCCPSSPAPLLPSWLVPELAG